MGMSVDDLLALVPNVLDQLTAELVRWGDASLIANPKSQLSACYLLALRALSLINGMEAGLGPETIDSYEVISRAHLEARDLLMTFRFDNEGARKKIGYWFAGTADNAWKAEHKKVDEFLTRRGALAIELSVSWSRATVLAHPTKYAAQNSAAVIASSFSGVVNQEIMRHKKADFLVMISRFIAAVTYDIQGWISLGCDPGRMPTVEPFHQEVEQVVLPVLIVSPGPPLPRQSYRS
jgi:hypothetical protein